MTVERRMLAGGIERREGESRRVGGLAAVFYNGTPGTQFRIPWLDSATERIMPGAFTRAIQEDDVRALVNHDANLLIGRNTAGTLRLWESEGLSYEADVPDTQAGRDLLVSLDRRDITGSSVGFNVSPGGDEWRLDDSGELIREIHQVNLLDVSPVTYPAYTATTSEARDVQQSESFRKFMESRNAAEREKIEVSLRMAENRVRVALAMCS